MLSPSKIKYKRLQCPGAPIKKHHKHLRTDTPLCLTRQLTDAKWMEAARVLDSTNQDCIEVARVYHSDDTRTAYYLERIVPFEK